MTVVAIDCPLCQGRSATPIWREGDHSIVRCAACKLMQAHPLAELPLAYDEDYYRDGHHVENPLRRELFTERFNTVIGQAPSGGTILDIGCGTGDFLRVCHDHGWDTVGVDVSPFAAQITRERTGGEAHHGRIQELDLGDERFDVVHMHHMFEHVADPLDVLRHVYKLMKPQGRLVIEVPNERNLINIVQKLHGRQMLPSDKPPTHLLFFEEGTLLRTVRTAGFEIDSIDQMDLTTEARRQIYRYFDGKGNIISRTVEALYSAGMPSKMKLGVFLLLQGRRPARSGA